MSTPSTPDEESPTPVRASGITIDELNAIADKMTPEDRATIVERSKEALLGTAHKNVSDTLSDSVRNALASYNRMQEQLAPIHRILETQKRIDESLAPFNQILRLQEDLRERYSVITGISEIGNALSKYKVADTEVARMAVRISEALGASLRYTTESERLAALVGQATLSTEVARSLDLINNSRIAQTGAATLQGQAALTARAQIREALRSTWLRLGLDSTPDDQFGSEVESQESQFIVPNGGKIEAVITEVKTRVQFASAKVIELMQNIASDPKARFRLNGRELEELWAETLDRLGYEDVQLTPLSGDYGIDVYATQKVAFGKVKMGFQCKAYKESSQIDLQPVQAISAATREEGLGIGVLVTTTRFAPVSERWAGETFGRVQLVNGDELASTVRQVVELNR